MSKLTIAFLAFAFMTPALHAEEAKVGSGFASGLANGAGKGVGGPNDPSFSATKSADKLRDQNRSLLIKPAKPKSDTSGSSQQKGRH